MSHYSSPHGSEGEEEGEELHSHSISINDTERSFNQDIRPLIEFIIPLHFEDLALAAPTGRFAAHILPDSQIQPYIDTLQEINADLHKNPLSITNNDIFDPLYTMVSKWSKLTDLPQKRLVVVLTENLSRFLNLVPQKLQSPDLGNTLKMFLFLLSSILSKGELTASDEVKESAKATISSKQKKSEATVKNQSWTLFREKIISEFLSFTKNENLQYFWKFQRGKELKTSIGELIFKTTSCILENGSAMKFKAVKDMISRLLMHCIMSFELQVEACLFFMQALMKAENRNFPQSLGEILSNYIEIDQSHGTAFAGMIIREIGKLDVDDLGKDSSSSKAVSEFLEVLGEFCPVATLANISVLLPHLEMDNYMIRNGTVQMIGKVLLYLHSKVIEERSSQEDTSEENAPSRPRSNSGKTRNSLMQILLDRVNDITSYTRSKVLQTWKDLCDERAIPINFYALVCEISVQRLEDKSSQVRKYALQLLNNLLQKNPFGPSLKLSDFRQRMEKEGELSNQESKYCREAIHFLEYFDQSLEKIMSQLSQGPLLVLECVHLIKTANQFRIQHSEKGLKRLLPLVVSMAKEQEVHDAVVCAYADVFLPSGSNPKVSAMSLVKLNLSVSFSEKKCLSKIISHLVRNKVITKQVVSALSELFFKSSAEESLEKAGALEILSMIGQVNSSVIRDNLEAVLLDVFGSENKKNDLLVRAAFVLVLCLDSWEGIQFHQVRMTEFMVSVIEEVALGNIAVGPNWYGAAEQALNTLFRFVPSPHEICASLLRKLALKIGFGNSAVSCSSKMLSQSFFIVGHVGLNLLEQIDSIDSRLARARKTRLSVDSAEKKSENQVDDELGFANTDDFDRERLREEAENGLVAPNSMLGLFAPLVVSVCSNPGKFGDKELQMSAALALAKLMCTGSRFCEKNLQLLFTILAKSSDPRVRADILIGIGDLAVRFPNLIDPWTKHMFGCLKDRDQSVRKSSLMVLTHLVLNDMIKVKNDITEIALCITDEQQSISDAAKHFFVELSKKGNNSSTVYNLLPATINQLILDDQFKREKFRQIMKFLIPLASDKERHVEALLEKLCQKFDGTKDLNYCKELMFCISLLPFSSEKSISKFVSYFKQYKDLLYDHEICSHVGEIVEKMKKITSSKPDVKQSIDEFEMILRKLMNGELDSDSLEKANVEGVNLLHQLFPGKAKVKKAASAPKKKVVKSTTRGHKPARGKSKLVTPSSDRLSNSDSDFED